MNKTPEFMYFVDTQSWMLSVFLDLLYFGALVLMICRDKRKWIDLKDDVIHLLKFETRLIISFDPETEITFPISKIEELPGFVFNNGKISTETGEFFGEYKLNNNSIIGWYKQKN